MSVNRIFSDVCNTVLDERGFTYHDSRDLTCFIDGTANPHGEAARDAALIANGRPGAGGAYVLSQRWVHDLGRWRALSVSDQQACIGRTKADDVELGDAAPETAHIQRVEIEEDGRELSRMFDLQPTSGRR